jgi:hypothetical protein
VSEPDDAGRVEAGFAQVGEVVDGRGDVVEGRGPAALVGTAATGDPAVLDVPGRVPGVGEVDRERAAELEAVAAAPEAAVHHDDRAAHRAVAGGEGELRELARPVPVRDPTGRGGAGGGPRVRTAGGHERGRSEEGEQAASGEEHT